MVISADTIVEPFRLVATRRLFNYRVAAPGSGRFALLTGDEMSALQSLLKERVVGRAAERLSRESPTNSTVFAELIEKLAGAKLIHRLDGRVCEPRYASRRAIAIATLRHFISGSPMSLARLSQKAGTRVLPLEWMARVNRAVIGRMFLRRRRAGLTAHVRRNMARLLGECGPALDAYARAYVDAFERFVAELALLFEAPNHRIRAWVLRTVTMTPRSRTVVADALSGGRGAIVFSYHMGPMHYTPILLRAIGVKVTLLGMSVARPRGRKMYLSIVDDLRPSGIKKLLEALQRGEVVALSPDVDMVLDRSQRPNGQDAEMFSGTWGKGSRVGVRFFGCPVDAYAGLAWLHAQSGAPLIFASVSRNERGEATVDCSPFEASAQGSPGSRAWIRQVMMAVYRHYEHTVAMRPDEWLHWMSVFPGDGAIKLH